MIRASKSMGWPVLVGLLALRLHPLGLGAEETRPALDFTRDIRPILETHCLGCHGPDKRKGGLVLEGVSDLKQGGDGGPAFDLENPAQSRIILALRHDESLSAMPPDSEPLDEAIIGRIQEWIAAGTPGAEPDSTPERVNSGHWSLRPIARPEIPPLNGAGANWVRQPLDAFILARLESEGLTPSTEADRPTLIRRLSLDLIGLPPTPADVDAFRLDNRPDAYERLVDQLLDSPHFGERWGRHWLDVARYADSNGYTIDGPRDIWKYRDWVIDAVNRDLPFDQFVTWQLAGDLLPDATMEQRIATGFHRNTMKNEEGGTDPEQFRIESVVDRVATTGEAILGLTLACAQCHSHKFDPITQAEYYQLFAFFNDVDEPTLEVPTAAEAEQLHAVRERMAPIERELAARDRALAEIRAVWEDRQRAVLDRWQVLSPSSLLAAGGATFERLGDRSIRAGGHNSKSEIYELAVPTDLTGIRGIQLEVMVDESLPSQGPGRADNGNFILSEFKVSVAPRGDPTAKVSVVLHEAKAEHSQADHDIKLAIDGDRKTGWAINTADLKNANVARTAHFVAMEPFGFPGGSVLLISLEQTSGKRYNIGRFRLAVTTESEPPLVPSALAEALRAKSKERTKAQAKLVADAHQGQDDERKGIVARLDELRKDLPKVATTLVVAPTKAPRDTFVHIRGDFLNRGAKVEPGVPTVLPPLEATGRPSRLDFARWLFSPDHPLVARVAVNRIWQQLFGIGLVETDNDFGTQGTPPSHPELLDWLACEFREQGWSRKRLIRAIVTSATYRQTSAARDPLDARDPRNRLLARQARFRLEAEIIRDVALAASGRLSPQIGGPSVFPLQPEGVMVLAQVNRPWNPSDGSGRHRRGLYTYFWRSTPHPALRVFDAPDAQRTCTRRPRSNTPLQSLTLLNDPAFVDCAQGLADRLMAEGGTTDAERVRFGFGVCLGREPTVAEREILQRLLRESRTEGGMTADLATADPAGEVTGTGSEAPAPGGTDSGASREDGERTAWLAVARTLLNLDEFITRE